MHPSYFCINFVKPYNILIFLAHRYFSKFATKLQQNWPPVLMAVLTIHLYPTVFTAFIHLIKPGLIR